MKPGTVASRVREKGPPLRRKEHGKERTSVR